MIKKGFLYGVVLMLAFIFVYVFLKVRHLNAHANVDMPTFNFITLDGLAFNQDSIPLGTKKVAINHFDPECNYCEKFSQDLYNKKNLIGSERIILMVTSAKADMLNPFVEKYKLKQIPRVHILMDTTYQMETVFGSKSIPYTFIYGEQKKLLEKFAGEFDFNAFNR
jgi:thioredoxin-related protein